MIKYYIMLFCFCLSFLTGFLVCHWDHTDILTDQKETLYTQEQVATVINIALEELDKCEEELYTMEEDLIECQALCVKCILNLAKTKMKGVGHGFSNYFKFSLE